MTFRKFLFWCHLATGVSAGIVIFIMSVTGTLLMYEKQIIVWADTRHYTVVPPSPEGQRSQRLSIEALLARVSEVEPDTTFTTVTARADASAPIALAAAQRTLFVNPYTGGVMGEGSPGVRRFFRVVTDWHRVLAFSGDQRPIGRAITGACNLAFLFIIASGLYLWWPKTLTWRHWRTVVLFNGGLSGRARDFNWHNTIGFWSAIPLFVIVLGSLVISYPWASDMVYRFAGEAPPPRQQAAAGGGNAPRGERPQVQGPTRGMDALWARAVQQVPGWRTISFRMPAAADAPVVFTIDDGTGGQPQKKGTLTLDRPAGEVVRWEPFTSLSEGRQLRSWLRFAHTGEFYGLLGQTVAGVLSLGGGVLVYTGLALAFRRLLAWRVRSRSAHRPAVAAVARHGVGLQADQSG